MESPGGSVACRAQHCAQHLGQAGTSKTLDVGHGIRGWQHVEIWGCWSRKEGEPWLHPGWVCRADWPLGCRQWERRGQGRELVPGPPTRGPRPLVSVAQSVSHLCPTRSTPLSRSWEGS